MDIFQFVITLLKHRFKSCLFSKSPMCIHNTTYSCVEKGVRFMTSKEICQQNTRRTVLPITQPENMTLMLLYGIVCVHTCVTLDTTCTCKIQVCVLGKESAPEFGRSPHRKSISLQYFQAVDYVGRPTCEGSSTVGTAWLCALGVTHFQ